MFPFADYPIERFRKYDPATADRSFIRFGRQPLAPVRPAWQAARLAGWWPAGPSAQSKRLSAGEMAKDTSFIRFGKRAQSGELADEPKQE